MNINKDNRIMDSCANIWLFIGNKFRQRPATIIGIIVGIMLLVSILSYTIVEQYSTQKQVERITSAFCNGPDNTINDERCQNLLRALLKNPDRENVRRLKEIVKNTP